MNIMDLVGMAAKNPQIVSQMAKQFGLNEAQSSSAVSGLMKQLAGGVQKNV